VYGVDDCREDMNAENRGLGQLIAASTMVPATRKPTLLSERRTRTKDMRYGSYQVTDGSNGDGLSNASRLKSAIAKVSSTSAEAL